MEEDVRTKPKSREIWTSSRSYNDCKKKSNHAFQRYTVSELGHRLVLTSTNIRSRLDQSFSVPLTIVYQTVHSNTFDSSSTNESRSRPSIT